LHGVIFSTAVADVDHDGLPDGLEDAVSGLSDPPSPGFPSGQPLPNLNAMGASSTLNSAPHPDVFIEVNAMRTLVTKNHGSATAPYNSTATPPQITVPVPPHTHLPTPEVLKLIADAYVAHGITPHFDVGDLTSYHNLGVIPHTDWVDDYTSTAADPYLVSSNARGGEVVDELACSGSITTCQFPDFPGTVAWKAGMQLYRTRRSGRMVKSSQPPPTFRRGNRALTIADDSIETGKACSTTCSTRTRGA
jgi:hypothetical protein